jgi:hypothetical protein
MNIGMILIILLILMLCGVFPAWPHSQGYGYGPVSLVGVILIVVVVLLLTGRL